MDNDEIKYKLLTKLSPANRVNFSTGEVSTLFGVSMSELVNLAELLLKESLITEYHQYPDRLSLMNAQLYHESLPEQGISFGTLTPDGEKWLAQKKKEIDSKKRWAVVWKYVKYAVGILAAIASILYSIKGLFAS
ncbi:MAG: hypothetical protein IJG38_02355 [Thermoguttaceae bacterium]|nr:hypothetical protein [Thermoguttaceae bacterium]